ncbi:hypothetical protein DOT66_03165 [Ralstonia pseudosolanacearum]|nr:hypothetical protein RSOE_18070 [Ralstonia solanacearum OE1-1]AZU55631.1 hypothetical protein CFM90_04870 [Ralstonia solanacearum]RAA13470.1 hypothetical protein DOT66_03165 [Ralstonia pseudosolanacearum]
MRPRGRERSGHGAGRRPIIAAPSRATAAPARRMPYGCNGERTLFRSRQSSAFSFSFRHAIQTGQLGKT